MARHSLQHDVPFIISMILEDMTPQWNASDQMRICIGKRHGFGGASQWNADGKHCSKACVTELCLVIEEKGNALVISA